MKVTKRGLTMLKQISAFFFISVFSVIFCGTSFAQKNHVVTASDVDLYISLVAKDFEELDKKIKQAGLSDEDFTIIISKVQCVLSGWRGNVSEDGMIQMYKQVMRGPTLTKNEIRILSARKKDLVALDKKKNPEKY
ncbi:MAG: hypothetical protein LBD41_07615 [Clostridiales Family XIII bacterium]|jgi:hypothetical protein|nr:hypothetical protein [Clostridiales Family XIII bacterium]